jgi:hypothetical protein
MIVPGLGSGTCLLDQSGYCPAAISDIHARMTSGPNTSSSSVGGAVSVSCSRVRMRGGYRFGK